MRIVRAAAAFVVGCLVLGGTARASGSERARVPLTFASERHGMEVYLADSRGGHLRRLTNAVQASRWPAISPDGKRIAMTRKLADGCWHLLVMNLDGSGLIDVAGGFPRSMWWRFVGNADWSPDGRKLAFSQEFDGDSRVQLMVYDLASREIAQVTQDHSVNLRPRWSPDGRKLAYTSNGTGGSLDVYTINVDGSGRRALTSEIGWQQEPTWSPDGRRLAYTNRHDIWVMDADGSNARNVTKTPGIEEAQPSWSPSGIAFASTRDPVANIYVIQPDGSGLCRLTSGASQNRDPRWSSDGKQLVFVS